MDARDLFNQYFEVGKWASQDHYKCTKCNFDTLSKDKAINHLTKHIMGTVVTNFNVPEEDVESLSTMPVSDKEVKEKIEKMQAKKSK